MYDELMELGFPSIMYESIVDRRPLDPWDLKFEVLEKPIFRYIGPVVVDDKTEKEMYEYGDIGIEEEVEEYICVAGDTYENKVLITRCGWEGRCVSLVFMMREGIKEREVMHIWAPTFDELYSAFANDPYGASLHLKILEELIVKIGEGESFSTFEMVDKYDPCKDVDDDEWVFGRFPRDSVVFHPAVYYALMRQIMISEDKVYDKPYHDGRKRPLKGYKEYLERKGVKY